MVKFKPEKYKWFIRLQDLCVGVRTWYLHKRKVTHGNGSEALDDV